MKGLNLNLKTFIFICLTIVFLITAPLFLPDLINNDMIMDPILDDKPDWTGVLSLWYVPYIDTAGGNQVSWLNSYIRSFEKQHPGVFIDLEVMNSERLALYFYSGKEQDFLPDMISLDTYDKTVPEDMLLDLSPYFGDTDLGALYKPVIDSAKMDDKLTGIPWMIGAYGLFINNSYRQESSLIRDEGPNDYDILDRMARDMSREEQSGRTNTKYFGFNSYATPHTRPLLSIIYDKEGKINNKGFNIVTSWIEDSNICPPNQATIDYTKAFNLFANEQRTGIFLGSSKVLYDLRRLDKSGKGIDFTLYPIPCQNANGTYQDQIAAIGILDISPDNMKNICVMFLKGLLEEKSQETLTELGMFSVIESLKLYEDDEEMSMLEDSLTNMATGSFYNNKETVDIIWDELTKLSHNEQ